MKKVKAVRGQDPTTGQGLMPPFVTTPLVCVGNLGQSVPSLPLPGMQKGEFVGSARGPKAENGLQNSRNLQVNGVLAEHVCVKRRDTGIRSMRRQHGSLW